MNVTGTTSYTIDAYTADVAGSIVFTVDDRSSSKCCRRVQRCCY